ncbi:YraN family protein [Terracidiphilus sp.]|uniref:YraN family protein n=1 Tax=Terracidiphilus sp. TaxID=1964191 RepID=UPI003C210860
MRAALVQRAFSMLTSLVRLRGREKAPAHLVVGVQGEDAAFFHLLSKGYNVVARRWSARKLPGDVDIIAWQGQLLCFFEVKARTKRDLTPAHVAVDQHKRRVLRRLARAYLRQLPQGASLNLRPNVRFDVIAVYLIAGQKAEIEHFENSFGWDERRSRYEN